MDNSAVALLKTASISRRAVFISNFSGNFNLPPEPRQLAFLNFSREFNKFLVANFFYICNLESDLLCI
jgi:hypothetical protein